MARRDMFSNGLVFLGTVATLSFFCKMLNFFWKYYIRPFPSIRKLYGGSWALITGGSGGIGLEMAKLLARSGINLILIARDQNTLAAVANHLMLLTTDIKVRTIAIDAAAPNYQLLHESIQGLNISLLVNNVGVHNEVPANTEDLELNEIFRIISVNCTFHVQLTSKVIPFLKKRNPPSGATTIINISSLTSQMAMPMLGVYAASKAFEEHFSLNLAAEMQPYGIDVLCLRPGLTVSKMSGVSQPSFFCPSAAVMAHACVHMIGSGETSVVPYWPHALLDVANAYVPGRLLGWALVRSMHLEKRNSMLKMTNKDK